MGKPKIVCLCGSTRFSPLFAAVVLNPKYGYRGTDSTSPPPENWSYLGKIKFKCLNFFYLNTYSHLFDSFGRFGILFICL